MNQKVRLVKTSRIFSLSGFILAFILTVILCTGMVIGEDKKDGPLAFFNEEQLKTLKAGEPVCNYELTSEDDAGPAGHGQCSILVKAPIEKCFEHLEKIDTQTHWVPKKKRSRIANKDGNKHLIDNEYVVYGVSIEYYSMYTIIEKNYRLEYEIDKSKPHDFEENSGFYQLEKIDKDNTLLTFGSYDLDVGFSVPDFVTNFLLGRSLPEMATNAKKYIESDGKWRRDD